MSWLTFHVLEIQRDDAGMEIRRTGTRPRKSYPGDDDVAEIKRNGVNYR
jgi:hypothetical protein